MNINEISPELEHNIINCSEIYNKIIKLEKIVTDEMEIYENTRLKGSLLNNYKEMKEFKKFQKGRKTRNKSYKVTLCFIGIILVSYFLYYFINGELTFQKISSIFPAIVFFGLFILSVSFFGFNNPYRNKKTTAEFEEFKIQNNYHYAQASKASKEIFEIVNQEWIPIKDKTVELAKQGSLGKYVAVYKDISEVDTYLRQNYTQAGIKREQMIRVAKFLAGGVAIGVGLAGVAAGVVNSAGKDFGSYSSYTETTTRIDE